MSSSGRINRWFGIYSGEKKKRAIRGASLLNEKANHTLSN